MKYLLPFASTRVGKYKKKPCISLIYKAFCFLSGFLSDPLWSGKRDSHSRCARVVPRLFVDTPGPWQGRIEVAGDESADQNPKQQGEPNGSPCCFGAENGTRTRDLNLGKVALYQLSYFRKYLLLIASAKVTKICESPNFSVPFCNFFTITEPQDKSNRPPPASHTAYYQSDILHSEIKRTKSSGQSSPALRSRHRHPERS